MLRDQSWLELSDQQFQEWFSSDKPPGMGKAILARGVFSHTGFIVVLADDARYELIHASSGFPLVFLRKRPVVFFAEWEPETLCISAGGFR